MCCKWTFGLKLVTFWKLNKVWYTDNLMNWTLNHTDSMVFVFSCPLYLLGNKKYAVLKRPPVHTNHSTICVV